MPAAGNRDKMYNCHKPRTTKTSTQPIDVKIWLSSVSDNENSKLDWSATPTALRIKKSRDWPPFMPDLRRIRTQILQEDVEDIEKFTNARDFSSRDFLADSSRTKDWLIKAEKKRVKKGSGQVLLTNMIMTGVKRAKGELEATHDPAEEKVETLNRWNGFRSRGIQTKGFKWQTFLGQTTFQVEKIDEPVQEDSDVPSGGFEPRCDFTCNWPKNHPRTTGLAELIVFARLCQCSGGFEPSHSAEWIQDPTDSKREGKLQYKRLANGRFHTSNQTNLPAADHEPAFDIVSDNLF
ncbi:hypothetical protein FB45DRAFT_873772 [Roridomyces roridus]|uniref:Uncharacterized protein n=1 Tax=Roridomyces roridus TaxID=1738132 RepID=A0AAD7BAA1_9AGAR|nr:hypothetical protein FB45DRAFT_873772 [Roridomyces roridus]